MAYTVKSTKMKNMVREDGPSSNASSRIDTQTSVPIRKNKTKMKPHELKKVQLSRKVQLGKHEREVNSVDERYEVDAIVDHKMVRIFH